MPAGTGPGDLHALALEYLYLCAAAVATAIGGVIDRRFVSAGTPAWDCCPQLSVHVGGPAEAATRTTTVLDPGERNVSPGAVNLIQLTATVIRCVPTFDPETPGSRPPTPEALTAAAAETDGDVWAIWQNLRAGKRAGTLFAPAHREMFLDPASSFQSQGGCGGWQIPVRVELGGYPAP